MAPERKAFASHVPTFREQGFDDPAFKKDGETRAIPAEHRNPGETRALAERPDKELRELWKVDPWIKGRPQH
ncbi:MAG: hypothetical protein WD270_03670 [Acetobacterales bacterium]